METTQVQAMTVNTKLNHHRCIDLFVVSIIAIFSAPIVCGQSPTEIQLTEPQPSQQVLDAQQQRVEAMRKASLSTVGVFGVDGQGGGSGVCISADGYVLTNFHVSSPFGHRMRCSLNDGQMYEAVVAGIDPTGDLAVLKMFGRDDFPVADIGISDDVRIGQWCFAAGNPFVLATNLQPTITFGLVSGVRRYQYPSGTILEYSDCIQTDASINPGNSGGPLFNIRGELIGINGRCSFEKRGRVNVGVGYAISIKQAMNFLWQLRSGRIVDHATLGFTVATDDDGRVTVANILETSDAFRRGLRFGDEILRLGDRDVTTTNQLKNILGIYPAQWRIPLRYRNDEGVVDTFVRLQNLHLPSELDEIVKGEAPEQPKPLPKSPQDEPEQPKDGPGETLEALRKWAETKKDALADRYEARRGFSNYYFNKFELDRILALQATHGNWNSSSQKWKLTGEIPNENLNIEITLSDTDMSLTLGEKTETLLSNDGWQPLIKQRSQLGLVMALRIWQQWYRRGPRLMGEAVYIGQSPIVGRENRLDTTRITISDVDTLVHTSPMTGEIESIEVFVDNQFDPVEVFFEKYDTIDGRLVPTLVRLVYGLETQFVVSISKLDTTDAETGGGL